MVYRGVPSEACLMCRAKRIKCDLAKPACARCIKHHRVCEYRNRQDLMFCDQSRVVALKSQRQTRWPNISPSTTSKPTQVEPLRAEAGNLNLAELPSPNASKSIFRSPSPKLEDQASCFFFNSYVVNCWGICQPYFDYLPTLYQQISTNSALSSIIVALGMSGLSRFQRMPGLARLSRAKYAHALRSVNAALQDPEEVKKDRTLIAIMLLGLYETTTSKTQRSLTYFTKHVRGALALLRLRGKEQFKTAMGSHIFIIFRASLNTGCLQTRVIIPQDVHEWTEEAEKHCAPEFHPTSALARLTARVSHLRAQAEFIRCNKEHLSIIAIASAIDADLQNWASNVPSWYKYSTVLVSQRSQDVFANYYHMYHDYYTAGIWNSYRSKRIIVQEILMDELLRLHELFVPTSQDGDSPYSSQIRVSTLLIREMIHDIYASVPQYLGHMGDAEDPDLMNPFRAAVGASFLLWPLYVAGSASSAAPRSMRMWAANRLDRIVELSGIQQASFLAQALRDDDEVTEHMIEDLTQLPESDLED